MTDGERSTLALSESGLIVIIGAVPDAPSVLTASIQKVPSLGLTDDSHELRLAAKPSPTRGQVAQVVERSPEKAGVGGSTPSLATTFQST